MTVLLYVAVMHERGDCTAVICSPTILFPFHSSLSLLLAAAATHCDHLIVTVVRHTMPAILHRPTPYMCQVLRSTDGSSVELVRQWDAPRGERAVVAWTRSLGCPFCQELAIQLRRDVKPRLDAMGVKLLMVSIGESGRRRGGGEE